PHPDVAGVVALRALREGSLAERLTALELFDAWDAPLAGLDPWKPDTIDTDRLARLEGWLDEASSQGPSGPAKRDAPEALSDEQRAAAHREIDRMLAATDAEAAAMRDRLARFGPALSDQVDRRLADAATDRHRERLLALRYRLAASDTLELRWPGGLERLSATETATRQHAAEQLAALATAADQPLLLRLFADPDPLVREIALQGLHRVGGAKASGALADLLSDPEPNVRAAVLKLLEENPAPAMVPRVAAYLKTENDPDLIVHALRFLRASGGPEATGAMMELVDHSSWQVRAEAAAGLGNVETSFRRIGSSDGFGRSPAGGGPDERQAEAYVALIDLLDDPDAFVVGRAVEGLSGADLAIAVEPLVEAAAAHPELASNIMAMLAQGEKMRPKAVPHLRRFTRHEDPVIRAAAVTGLVKAVPSGAEKELSATLDDPDSGVRIAGAVALATVFENASQAAIRNIEEQQQGIERSGDMLLSSPTASSPSLLGRLGGALGALFRDRPRPADAEAEFGPGEPMDLELEPPAAEVPPRQPVGDEPEEEPEQEPEEQKPEEKDAKAPDVEGTDPSARDGSGEDDPEVSGADLLDPGPDWDRWLEGFHQGKGRPPFAAEVVDSLREMLTAEGARERMAAALALVPLGRADEALPVLLETARAAPRVRGDAVAVLPWLAWPRRRATFEQLWEMLEEDERYRLVRSLLPVADRRAAELLWDMLGDERGERLVSAIHRQLRKLYFGSGYYRSAEHIAPVARAEAARALKPRVAAGGDARRMVALTLLLKADPAEAAATAEPLAGDEMASEPLRNAAFQVLLAAQPEPQRQATAVAALEQDDDFQKALAVAYLAEGKEQLKYFLLDGSAGSLDLDVVDDEMETLYGRGGPKVPELPPELRPDHLHPLLEQGNPTLAARAGYLLVLLGEEKGMEPLLRAWQEQDEENMESGIFRRRGSLKRLVYRAIATLDDSSRIDVLREIRKTLDDYSIRDFYWTIRIMSGPEVLRLRKEIRDEVGMKQLR
ncbi:MAG: HEAT repeat domain-containing protein, partial [Pirellulales bacterium]